MISKDLPEPASGQLWISRNTSIVSQITGIDTGGTVLLRQVYRDSLPPDHSGRWVSRKTSWATLRSAYWFVPPARRTALTLKRILQTRPCMSQMDKVQDLFERLGVDELIPTEALCLQYAEVFDWAWAASRLINFPTWDPPLPPSHDSYEAGEEFELRIAAAERIFDAAPPSEEAWQAQYRAFARAFAQMWALYGLRPLPE
jgi:hypothetical protein